MGFLVTMIVVVLVLAALWVAALRDWGRPSPPPVGRKTYARKADPQGKGQSREGSDAP